MTGRDMGEDPDWSANQAPATTPDPGEATTVQEFVCRMRAFKAWSGNPSLRELERRTGLPRSTLWGDMSPQRRRLPPLERVLALATAFGVSAEELARWQSAWQRIQVRQQSAEPAAPASPAVVEPPAPEVAPQARQEPDRKGRHRFARRRIMWPVVSVSCLLVATLALSLTAARSSVGQLPQPVTGRHRG